MLRLGNADGSLASVVTFREQPGGGFEAVEVTKCISASPNAAGDARPLIEDLPRSENDLTAADLDSERSRCSRG